MNGTPAARPIQPARILIVDDERLNRQLLHVMLESEGYLLLSADSGDEAMMLIAHQPPDLILLDVMMPRMDGYELTCAVKSNAATRHIPVVIITSLDDRHSIRLALEAGAEEFLTKPVDCDELCLRVRNLLRLKACGDEHRAYIDMLELEVVSRTAALVERVRALEQETAALRRSDRPVASSV